MKILMKSTQIGCPNGIIQKEYKKDEEYTFATKRGVSLAELFIKNGHAEEVTSKKGKKMAPGPAKNKAATEPAAGGNGKK